MSTQGQTATREENSKSEGEFEVVVKDRAALQDALLELRGRLLTPASKWNARARAEALTVLDRALEAL